VSAPYRRPGPARVAAFAVAGLAWGSLAWLVGFRTLDPEVLAGVAVSPVIGLVIGVPVQGRFERASWSGQVGLALVSLYVGATLFALAMGAAGPETLWTSVTGVWYGTTVLLIVLYPLTYLTHLALASDSAWWRSKGASSSPRP
jgi:hypothetical protein